MPTRQRVMPALLLSFTAMSCPHPARGAPPTVALAIEGVDLEHALVTVARLSGREIVFSSQLVEGLRAPRLAGRFTPEEAVRKLLAGTGLDFQLENGAIVIVRRDADEAPETSTIVVTGSRIRGAQAYAPLTVLDRETLRAQGTNDLGDAIRRVPQNFGGGQSPIIGLGAENYGNENLNSGSSINLRGLGPDATLTLLNGHRLAYDGVIEGVDVSAIPLAAIDRVEIVADGASAIYGSDAVAGVANVVLRRDATGLYTSARLGATTDGGDWQQQYELVTGGRWQGGGAMIAASYDRNTAITADQRSVTRTLGADTVIFPSMRHLATVLTAHQAVTDTVSASIDMLYSRRRSFTAFPNPGASDYLESGLDRHPATVSFAVSPSAVIQLSPQWSATLGMTYGRDLTRYHTRFFEDGALFENARGRYDNRSLAVEGSAEGPLVSLPGGDARLAIGAGYRRASLAYSSTGIFVHGSPRQGHRESEYGFAELNAPVFGASNARPGLQRLSFNAAARFEHYPKLGNVFTPKVGALYAPVRAIELRGTWGRSFKAPTLYQLYAAPNAFFYDAAGFGGTGFPTDATAIFASGGNPDLKPQRATTWTAGVVLKPFGDQNLKLDASYFDIHYRDRIAEPVTSDSTALSDPLLASIVRYNPTLEQIMAIADSADLGLLNATDRPFDPAAVVAIIDDRVRNVAAQSLRGVDVSATGRVGLSHELNLDLIGSATYLDSSQRLLPGQPAAPLAGQIFRPPHFRGQAGATVSTKQFAVSAYVNRTGGLRDERLEPIVRVHGQTTFDLSARYQAPARSGPLHGVTVLLAIVDLFNSKPDRIRNSDVMATPFDATNFSPVGRSISLTLAKQW